ncbi:MAG TPA: hypothetical protein VGJ11_01690, partial [Gaiellales bacterium]
SELLDNQSERAAPLHRLRPDLPRDLSRALERAMHPDPGRRPDAAGLRDQLLAAVAVPSVTEAPGFAPAAAPVRRRLAIPFEGLRERTAPAGSALLVGGALGFTLTAFPMYPPAWTIPLAVLVGALAWRRPLAALVAGAFLAVPAFWNFAEAAGLVWIGLAAAWIWFSRRNPGRRCLAPLAAIPLALVGMGTAIVLVAATAPTRGRRAAEAGAGAIVGAVCAGRAGDRLSAGLAGANSPFAYLHIVDRDPALAAACAAIAAFAVLLPFAWWAERRTQACALWGLGFALAVIAIPQLLTSGSSGLGTEIAAALTAIIPAVWAVAGPDPKRGG